MNSTKKCGICGQVKPTTEFYKKHFNSVFPSQRFQSWCKACRPSGCTFRKRAKNAAHAKWLAEQKQAIEKARSL